MAQHVGRNRLHIVGCHERAAAQKCVRAGRLRERDRGARTRAIFDQGRQIVEAGRSGLTRRMNDVYYVIHDPLVHIEIGDPCTCGHYCFG